jgi:hypothetical protein
MKVIEIYDAIDDSDFDNVNSIFLTQIKNAGYVPQTDFLYSKKIYVNNDTGRIGLIIREDWREALLEGLSDAQLLKIKTINSVDDAAYFPVVPDK